MEQNEWMDNFFNKSCLNMTSDIETLMKTNKLIT
jgi:hypothetical protein